MNKKRKIRKVSVVMERYTTVINEMLLRVSGGGELTVRRAERLWELLTDVSQVDKVIVSDRYVLITTDRFDELNDVGKDPDWSVIVPDIRKVLVKFFGRNIRITEQKRRRMDMETSMTLGEVELEDIREMVGGWALTEDECEGLGINFHQHHDDLVSRNY